jgi:hypothetical protein
VRLFSALLLVLQFSFILSFLHGFQCVSKINYDALLIFFCTDLDTFQRIVRLPSILPSSGTCHFHFFLHLTFLLLPGQWCSLHSNIRAACASLFFDDECLCSLPAVLSIYIHLPPPFHKLNKIQRKPCQDLGLHPPQLKSAHSKGRRGMHDVIIWRTKGTEDTKWRWKWKMLLNY